MKDSDSRRKDNKIKSATAARWKAFKEVVERTKARNADIPQEEIDAAVDEALANVRATKEHL